MDTAYWTATNPKVAFEDTKKQYFGKYLIKVLYHVPSAVYINKAMPGKMKDYIAWREAQAIATGGRWGGAGYNSYWTRNHNANTDTCMLEHFTDLKSKHKQLKYRLESNHIGVYANDEALLKAFNDSILPAYRTALCTITRPKDTAQASLLANGHILGVNKIGFKYKVMFCDGKFDAHAKQQLMHYFDSLGDIVKVPKSTRQNFEAGHTYSWGNYIHTNDLSILSFVSLIVPGLVGKTYELTKI